MPAQEQGLFYPDGSFKSRSEMFGDQDVVHFLTPSTRNARSFGKWTDIFTRRQEERKEAFGIPEHVEIAIDTDEPILLVPFGDVHAGALETDYKRWAREVALVAETPGAYALSLGDMTDSFFWGGAAQDSDIGSYGEQNEYLRTGLMLLGERSKLLAAWLGDHDGWVMNFGDTVYDDFIVATKAYYLEGVSYISLKVGDILYRISGAHRHNGFSIYNKAHPALRLYRDSAEGSDIAITAHTHQKAHITQPVKTFGGEAFLGNFLAVGSYKSTDEYARKKGFSRQDYDQMGAQSILLWPDKKRVEVMWDVETGIHRLNQERGR